jgi:hypothetical protein
VREVHDATGLAVDEDDVPFADIGGFHRSGNISAETEGL